MSLYPDSSILGNNLTLSDTFAYASNTFNKAITFTYTQKSSYIHAFKDTGKNVQPCTLPGKTETAI